MKTHRFSIKSAASLCAILGVAAIYSGCANSSTDRCYLPLGRYEDMKAIFLQTGSMQRVEQTMDDLGWAECEKNQLRYWLSKDLYLDDLEEELGAEPAKDYTD